MDSKSPADLLLADLDAVVERTREAYLDRVPKLSQMPPATLDAVLEATRRTMREFARYYAEGTLDTEGWRKVRDATLERAGETFSHDEIIKIIDVAHAVGLDAVERLAVTHPELSDAERAGLTKAIKRYVTELEEQEDRLRRLSSPDRLDTILGDLEAEGADLQ